MTKDREGVAREAVLLAYRAGVNDGLRDALGRAVKGEHRAIKASMEYIEPLIARTPPTVSVAWLPIESAPKDGAAILGYCDGVFSTVEWTEGGYWHLCLCGSYAEDGEWTPTHWRPLPDPPTTQAPVVDG